MARIATSRATAYSFVPEDLIIVGLDTEDGVGHPLYDERIKLPLDDGMIESIITHGVKVLINVAKDGDNMVVVDGRQRVRHAREANKVLAAQGKPPVVVRGVLEGGSAEDQALIGVLTNEQRVGDGPAVRAAKAKRLLALGQTEKAVALAFGWTNTGPLKQLLAYDSLDRSVKGLVDEGKLSWSAAAKLAPLKREDQAVEAAKLVASGATSTEAIKDHVRAKRTGTAQGNGAPSKTLLRKIVEEALRTGDDSIDPLVIKTLRWVIGDVVKAEQIGGIKATIRAISGGGDAE